MKVGVIGVGVVGSAVKKAFEQHFEVVAYDKFKPEYSSPAGLLYTDIVFVCVPTLNLSDGTQDLGPLNDVMAFLDSVRYPGIIVNKCTTLPQTTFVLSKLYTDLKIVHYPEFLTEAHAYEDFINQKTVILGGKNEYVEQLVPYFQAFNSEMKFEMYEDPSVTETIKYVHNCFLSTKVEFFNEIYDVCRAIEIDYNSMMAGVHAIGQVGQGHTKVPGPDGQFGFGGVCFPKDTKAFMAYAKGLQVGTKVLDATIEANHLRRG